MHGLEGELKFEKYNQNSHTRTNAFNLSCHKSILYQTYHKENSYTILLILFYRQNFNAHVRICAINKLNKSCGWSPICTCNV